MKEDVRRDIDKCVRCGACKAVCPTHALHGTEPQSARGRMVLLAEYAAGNLKPSELLNRRIYSCTLCAHCEQACPAGVRVTEAIYQGRAALRGSDRQRRLMRMATRVSLKWPGTSFQAASMFEPLLRKVLARRGVPFSLRLPEMPLRNGRTVFKPHGKSRGRVAVFTGCSINYLYPSLGESLIRVLRGAGYEVVLPPGEVCCGEPLRALGLEDVALNYARRNMEVFGRLRADAVVSLCPTCTLAIKVHYGRTLGRGIENAMDVSQLLVGQLSPVGPPPAKDIAYHNPCHLRALGVTDEPVRLLRELGMDVPEPAAEPGCCGFSTSLWDSEESEGLLERTMKALGAGRRKILTACPGCMMQLGRAHSDVGHIIEAVEACALGPVDKKETLLLKA